MYLTVIGFQARYCFCNNQKPLDLVFPQIQKSNEDVKKSHFKNDLVKNKYLYISLLFFKSQNIVRINGQT